MAKNNKDKTVEEKSDGKVSAKMQLSAILKSDKTKHFNLEKKREPYVVSSGSLLLDLAMDGGIRPSIVKFAGISEGGKSSCAVSFMKNFLSDKTRKRRGLYVKAEGRLSENFIARSGVKMVDDTEEWEDGTCFIFKSNNFEYVISTIRKLVNFNEEEIEYMIVFDSMDGLVPNNDLEKEFDEPDKMAGSALLSSAFLRKMGLSMTEKNHIAIMIGQVRARPKINPYEKMDANLTNSTGGFAQQHWASWMAQFEQKFSDDFIYENDDKKGKKIGHWCKVVLKKTDNETTGNTIRYPIKHGRKNGTSVWVELEVVEMLKLWGLITITRKVVEINQDLIKELAENNIEIKPKFRESEFLEYLEENQNVTEYFVNKFRSMKLE